MPFADRLSRIFSSPAEGAPGSVLVSAESEGGNKNVKSMRKRVRVGRSDLSIKHLGGTSSKEGAVL